MELMDVTHPTPMANDETAALLFVCGDQYLFRYRGKNGTLAYKFVSPASVRAAFAEERIDTAWLPPSARRWGIGGQGEWLLLAFPPQRYHLAVEEVGDEQLPTHRVLPMPALAFLGYGQRYYVWAFKERVLHGKTNLFAAPLPNVDERGAICFGNNSVPKASAQTIESAWSLFLTSPFSSHSVNGKSRRYPNDVRQQWLHLTQGNHPRYPRADLVDIRCTADAALESTLSGRGG